MAPQDPVTVYARKVTAGDVVASRLVRQACQRHLDDLARQADTGLEWRPQRALEAIQFFPDVLCLPDRSGGDVTPETGEPKPFALEPWQQFIVGSMFGWFTAAGFRRFREAYIETAKGSGKTPLGAGMMLYLLVADGERGAQIFLAAVKREQADVAWRDVLATVDASPCLRDALDRKANNLALLEDGSFLRPVSSETRGLDGKRVHGALVDELHEHPIHPEARVRVVVNEFTGRGINAHEGDHFVIAAHIEAPPALMMNSEHYDGPAPFNAIRYDQAAHDSYLRANTPRVEPTPSIVTMLTAAEVCAERGWSKSDLDVACSSGLKPSGWRDVLGEDGISIGLQPLFDPEIVTRWMSRLQALQVGAR